MRDDETRRLEELWTRFLARQPLGAEDRAYLAAALERDEAFRRRMIQDLQLDGALRAAGEIDRGQESLIATVRALVTAAGHTEQVVAAVRKRIEAKAGARTVPTVPPVRSRLGRAARLAGTGLLMAGAAAALVLLISRRDVPTGSSPEAGDRRGTALAPGQDQPTRAPGPGRGSTTTPPSAGGPRAIIARLETIHGRAYLHGADGTQRAAPRLELAAGDWVSISGPMALARLSGPGGSRIEIAGDAVAGLAANPADPTGARLFIAHGRATAVVPPSVGAAGLVLASPQAIVTGAGTLRLEVGPATTRIEVRAGRARVSALSVQHATDLQAGQFALVRADDLQPPRAQLGAREALLLTGPDDTKEEPPPPEGLRGSEERLKARLERLGFQVTVLAAAALTPERAREAAVLVFSSSVSSNLLEPAIAELPVPLLVLESTGLEQLGLTGRRWRRDIGTAPPLTDVVIENPGHPLAAGLTGTVRVLAWPLNVRWAAPLPGASLVATYPGAPEHAGLLFGYERGATTALGPAPARRVGLFLGNGRIIRALTEPGWRLFDAAVLWCAGG
jgi:hypothetical protein